MQTPYTSDYCLHSFYQRLWCEFQDQDLFSSFENAQLELTIHRSWDLIQCNNRLETRHLKLIQAYMHRKLVRGCEIQAWAYSLAQQLHTLNLQAKLWMRMIVCTRVETRICVWRNALYMKYHEHGHAWHAALRVSHKAVLRWRKRSLQFACMHVHFPMVPSSSVTIHRFNDCCSQVSIHTGFCWMVDHSQGF